MWLLWYYVFSFLSINTILDLLFKTYIKHIAILQYIKVISHFNNKNNSY